MIDEVARSHGDRHDESCLAPAGALYFYRLYFRGQFYRVRRLRANSRAERFHSKRRCQPNASRCSGTRDRATYRVFNLRLIVLTVLSVPLRVTGLFALETSDEQVEHHQRGYAGDCRRISGENCSSGFSVKVL